MVLRIAVAPQSTETWELSDNRAPDGSGLYNYITRRVRDYSVTCGKKVRKTVRRR